MDGKEKKPLSAPQKAPGIIDGDGHVMEDIAAIWKQMPEGYVGKSFSDIRGKMRQESCGSFGRGSRHSTTKVAKS